MRYIKTTPNKWIYHYTVTTPASLRLYGDNPFFKPSTEYPAKHQGGNMFSLWVDNGPKQLRTLYLNATGDLQSGYQPYKVKKTKTPNPEYAVWLAKQESLK